MSELVSIITPTYNSERYIEETILSVIAQTHHNWEHIIIDDRSQDRTKEIIEKYASVDKRIKPVYLSENKGVANARNYGILNSRGTYIAFLDSDDLWKPYKLKTQLDFMKQYGYGFTYSYYDIINGYGTKIKENRATPLKINYKRLLNNNPIGCLTVLIKADVIKNRLMPVLKHEDYATWLNILKHDLDYAYCIPEILASYRRINTSVSSNKIKTLSWTWNIYRNNQGLGIARSMKQLITFIALTSVKYIRS